MGSPNLNDSSAVSLAEFGTDVQRRRQAAGVTEVPRNSGSRRTDSKKALLKAIEAAGGTW